MQGRQMSRFIIVLLALLSFVCMGYASSRPEILEMRTCRGVKEWATSFDAKDWTFAFSGSDKYIYCVVKVRIPCGASRSDYSAELEWYTPEGYVYKTQEYNELHSCSVWSLSGYIQVAGTKAATMPGQWKVVFTMKFGPRRSVSFTLGESSSSQSVPSVPESVDLPASPVFANPSLSAEGKWQLGKYVLSVVNSIKFQFAYGVAHVTLIINRPNTDDWVVVGDVAVDTGAFESVLPISVISELGLDPSSGEKIEFHGVVGADVGWEHEMKIGVILFGGGEDTDGYILGKGNEPFFFTIPILFYGDEESSSKLLGRSGVLSCLNLVFDERVLEIVVPND
jgi:hypothetical protein